MENPFTAFTDPLYLTALLRAWNRPEYDNHKARPYLNGLASLGYLKNTSKRSSVPWWGMTEKGRQLIHAFVDAEGTAEKEAYLQAVHNAFE